MPSKSKIRDRLFRMVHPFKGIVPREVYGTTQELLRALANVGVHEYDELWSYSAYLVLTQEKGDRFMTLYIGREENESHKVLDIVFGVAMCSEWGDDDDEEEGGGDEDEILISRSWSKPFSLKKICQFISAHWPPE